MKYRAFFVFGMAACLMALAGCEKQSATPQDVNAYDPDLDGLPHMIPLSVDPTLAEDQGKLSREYTPAATPAAPAAAPPGEASTPEPPTAAATPATPMPGGPPTP